MARILVTGGAGFIGSHLVDALVLAGHEVVILDNLSTGLRENLNPGATFLEIDIANTAALQTVPGTFDAVYHLAAKLRVQESFEKIGEYHRVNVDGTQNMLEFARTRGVRRFLFASSCSVYGDVAKVRGGVTEETSFGPMSPYASHKLIGEKLCELYSRSFDLDTVRFRFFNVYGARISRSGGYVGAIRKFLDQYAAGEPFSIWGDGTNERDYIHVSDLVSALVAALTAVFPDGSKEHVFNLGSAKAYSVNDLADMIGGKEYPRVHMPAVKEPRWMRANISLAHEVLGFTPKMTLLRGIRALREKK